MRILTDFPKFPDPWKTSTGVEGESVRALAGTSLRDLFKLIPDIRRADLVLIHEGGSKLLGLVLLFWVLPFLKKPIVAVDLLLRKPQTAKERLSAWVKKIVLKRVDHFIHYFRALEGYEKIYGISPARSSYVPFKANIYGHPKVPEIASMEREEYVFAVGWSLRDYDTFFEAVSRLPYPAAILRPDRERLKQHGSRLTWKIENLPRNLVMIEHDASRESWIRNLCKARLVVIPMLRRTLCAGGISVYMEAMLLGKCVVISDVPGVSDVLRDQQAIIVPPEDPEALAQAIRKVWEDPVLRQETALRGQRYAAALGGEPELMQRILDRAVAWYLNPNQ